MKPTRRGARTFAVCTLAAMAAIAPMARAAEVASTAVGRVDLMPFAITVFQAEAEDVARFMPAGFDPVQVGGKTSLFINVGIFDDMSFEFANGSRSKDPDRFSYAELFVPTYGPGASGEGGIVGLWRLASAPIFPVALARLGLDCGRGGPRRTMACHVPGVKVVTRPSPGTVAVEASVPWRYSPYSVSASFVRTLLPGDPVNLPIPAWHEGPSRFVREDIVWGSFPKTAVVGLGVATVTVAAGSPLYSMLGAPKSGTATGAAILLRARPVQGNFTSYDKSDG